MKELIRFSLARFFEIKKAIFFGSLATGRKQRDSGIDLAGDMGRPMAADVKIALIGESAIFAGSPADLIDLQTVGEPLFGQIFQNDTRLLGEGGAYAELIKRHVFAAADFMPSYRRILAERRNTWIAK